MNTVKKLKSYCEDLTKVFEVNGKPTEFSAHIVKRAGGVRKFMKLLEAGDTKSIIDAAIPSVRQTKNDTVTEDFQAMPITNDWKSPTKLTGPNGYVRVFTHAETRREGMNGIKQKALREYNARQAA